MEEARDQKDKFQLLSMDLLFHAVSPVISSLFSVYILLLSTTFCTVNIRIVLILLMLLRNELTVDTYKEYKCVVYHFCFNYARQKHLKS